MPARRRPSIIVATLALLLTLGPLPVHPSLAETSTLYDFDTAGDLDRLFAGVGTGVGSVSQELTGGIDDSGSIRVPLSSVNAVFTSKDGYSLGPVGSTYRFSTYLKSEGNSGYSGVGFTIASPANASFVTAFRPDDAFGISVHGGGFIFHNGATNYSGSWGSASNTGIETIVSTSCSDLINNNTSCGSPDKWFRVFFTVERVSETGFDLTVEVWPSDADGTLRFETPSAAFAVRDVQNAAILDAPQLFSYFSFSGTRVTRFDEYAVELSGGATVVAPGSPVVLTESVEVVGNPTISLAGRVAADGGSPVSERGFVYATTPGPTTAANKVAFGAGTGAFSGETALPASGTYFFRSFATNANGTSYGAERSVVYVASGGGDDGSDDPVIPPAPSAPTTSAATPPPVLPPMTSGSPAVLLRGGEEVPLSTTTAAEVGPSGGLVIEDPEGSLRVTLASVAGTSPTGGLLVPPDGEIVCEICAQLARDTVVEAWVFSEPRLAAAVLVEEDPETGCPLLRIPVGAPLDGAGPIVPGLHTLQLRMTTPDGMEVLAVPITISSETNAAAVPRAVNAGEGPVPLVPLTMVLLIALLTAVVAATERERVVAGAASIRHHAQVRAAAERRLPGFENLQRSLDTMRRGLRNTD